MINVDQCDPLCIYSTLRFVVSQARFINETPVLTFDKPLYWKALKGRIVQPPKTGLKCTSAAAPTLQQTVACQSCPLTIIQSQPNGTELNQIVLRFGGFHMQMSFLGSIGHLMAGSGLQELLEVVYAGNTCSDSHDDW